MSTPTWQDAVPIQPLAKVAAGAILRAAFNVRSQFGGYLFIRAMRLSSSAPSNGIYIAVRRLLSGQPAGGPSNVDITHSQPLFPYQDVVTASNLTTLNGTPAFPSAAVTLTSATGFAGNQICGIVDSVAAPTIFECGRTSKISGTTLTFDRNLGNTNVATGHTITNNCIILPPVWVDGGPNIGDVEVVFDNGLEATVPYAVEAWGQQLQSVG